MRLASPLPTPRTVHSRASFASRFSANVHPPRAGWAAMGAVMSILLLIAAPLAVAAPSLRIVRFNDLKPDQARITTCWDALGIDHEQRVYIAFSDQSELHPYDT